MELLRTVEVIDNVTKESYTLYADNTFKTMSYAGADEDNHAPRFSVIEYLDPEDSEIVHLGQVTAMFSYSPTFPVEEYGDRNVNFTLLVARLKIASTSYQLKKKLPLPLMTYALEKGGVYIDHICHSKVYNPAFYVPSVEFNMTIQTVGDLPGKDSPQLFYVIKKDKIQCTYNYKYDYYLGLNDTKFCKENPNPLDLNMNPYLSVEEMVIFKDRIHSTRGGSVEDREELEAYEYEYDNDGGEEMEED